MDGNGGPPHSRTKQRRPKPGGGQQNCRPSTHGEQRNKSGTQTPSPPGPAVHLNPGQQVKSIPPQRCPNRAEQGLGKKGVNCLASPSNYIAIVPARRVKRGFCCKSWHVHDVYLLLFQWCLRLTVIVWR